MKKVNKRLINKWESAVRRLDAVMKQIQDVDPDYNLYLQEETCCLLSGQSHDHDSAHNMTARQDRVVTAIRIQGSGGGAW